MVGTRARRSAIVILTLFIAGLLSAGIARAVSGGDYEPSEMDCSEWAEANNFQGTEPGCTNFKINVEDSGKHRYAQFGIDQQRIGENTPSSGFYKVNTNSDGGGAGVSGTLASGFEPFTPDSCDFFSTVLLPFSYIQYLAGQGDEPCTLTPSGQTPAPGNAAPTISTGTPDGSIAGLLTDARFYMGADDNLNGGEHDGVHRDCTGIPDCTPYGDTGSSHSQNGPSDGGAVTVNWHPLQVAEWLATLAANPGDPTPFLTNPFPVADAGIGACADNVCATGTTRQMTLYSGCTDDNFGNGVCKDNPEKRDVYDYSGKKWDPEECSSGNVNDEDECDGGQGNPHTMDQYRRNEAQRVVAEPGVQVYGDPDAQSSPIGPYPLPAAYAGTCGVTVGGGDVDLSGTPVSNSAGQASVSTGC